MLLDEFVPPTPEHIRRLLGHLGPRIHGLAPRGPRWPAIQSYIAQHGLGPVLTLDDLQSEFPDPPPPELLLCDGRTGISALAVQDLLRGWLTTHAL